MIRVIVSAFHDNLRLWARRLGSPFAAGTGANGRLADPMNATAAARTLWLRVHGKSRRIFAVCGRDVAVFLAFLETRLSRAPATP